MLIVQNHQLVNISSQKREIIEKKILNISKKYCLEKDKVFSSEAISKMIKYCFECKLTSMFSIFLFVKLYLDFSSEILLVPNEQVDEIMNWPERSDDDKIQCLFRLVRHV